MGRKSETLSQIWVMRAPGVGSSPIHSLGVLLGLVSCVGSKVCCLGSFWPRPIQGFQCAARLKAGGPNLSPGRKRRRKRIFPSSTGNRFPAVTFSNHFCCPRPLLWTELGFGCDVQYKATSPGPVAMNKSIHTMLKKTCTSASDPLFHSCSDSVIARKTLPLQSIFHWPKQVEVRRFQILTIWWVW